MTITLKKSAALIAAATLGTSLLPVFASAQDASADTDTTATVSGTSRTGAVRPVLLRIASSTASMPRPVLEDGNKMGARASTTMQARVEERQGAVMERGRQLGAREIENRIASLQKLLARVSEMKRLTDAQKATITATVNAQIASLTTLEAQLKSDTSTTTLKTDLDSITKAYRIYALVEPQMAVLAAADRAAGVADILTTISGKLSTRLASSSDTSLSATLSDMNTQIANAKQLAQAAIAETAALVPDNGDQIVAAANTAALKDARTKLQGAQKGLAAAREDAAKIIASLTGKATVSAKVDTSVSGGSDQ